MAPDKIEEKPGLVSGFFVALFAPDPKNSFLLS